MGIEEEVDNYGVGPPWHFTGRAVYQLHLVRADVARRIIPAELNLVEAFGYTLGGLYFAQYDSSPAGKFDELVALAGIVWNPPTSCAWAARVLVNSVTARDHGIQKVGLPSQLAAFSKSAACLRTERPKNKFGFLRGFKRESVRIGSKGSQGAGQMPVAGRTVVDVVPTNGPIREPLCRLWLPEERPAGQPVWPRIRMVLPSFSGRTQLQPHLLWYACSLQCGVRIVKPAQIELPSNISPSNTSSGRVDETNETRRVDETNETNTDAASKDIRAILSSRPILTMAFDDMKMSVAAPEPIAIKTRARREKNVASSETREKVNAPLGPRVAGNAAQVPAGAS